MSEQTEPPVTGEARVDHALRAVGDLSGLTVAEQCQRLSGLQTALASIDERSRRIVEARWLSEEPATLHTLAAEYGVSAERIRQIEQKALQKMRQSLNAWH